MRLHSQHLNVWMRLTVAAEKIDNDEAIDKDAVGVLPRSHVQEKQFGSIHFFSFLLLLLRLFLHGSQGRLHTPSRRGHRRRLPGGREWHPRADWLSYIIMPHLA